MSTVQLVDRNEEFFGHLILSCVVGEKRQLYLLLKTESNFEGIITITLGCDFSTQETLSNVPVSVQNPK